MHFEMCSIDPTSFVMANAAITLLASSADKTPVCQAAFDLHNSGFPLDETGQPVGAAKGERNEKFVARDLLRLPAFSPHRQLPAYAPPYTRISPLSNDRHLFHCLRSSPAPTS